MGACSCKLQGQGSEPGVTGNSDLELTNNAAMNEDEYVLTKQVQEIMKKLSNARGTSNILKQLGVVTAMISESRGNLHAFERMGCVGLVDVVVKNHSTVAVVVATFRILCEIAVSVAAKRSLCNAGLCEELVRALRLHTLDCDTCMQACRLICLLCFDATCTRYLIDLGAIEAVSACSSSASDKGTQNNDWRKHALDSLSQTTSSASVSKR